MISLEQILLLGEKVESAVAKIAQLQAENDALRNKCAELTNALSSKSEQLTSFEQNEGKIEDGILKALNKLSLIENSVLKVQAEQKQEKIIPTEKTFSTMEKVQSQNTINNKPVPEIEEEINEQPDEESCELDNAFNFNFQDNTESEIIDEVEQNLNQNQNFYNTPEEENNNQSDNEQFDIF